MDYFIAAQTQIENITIPPSKSYAQRAILAAALSPFQTVLKNVGNSDDVQHITSIAEQLGATVKTENDDLLITGQTRPVQHLLNVGESGLGIRLSTSICAVLNGNFTLTGTGSLLQRPIKDFENFLPQLGISVTTNNGFLPISIKGDATSGIIEIDGSLSSQYLSGLLMALPLLDGESTILVDNLKSKPYIDITLDLLREFGIQITHDNYTSFKVKGNQVYKSNNTYRVEGDYSGASIWMVYGALTNSLKINGLKKDTTQGDAAMLDALKKAKVGFKWKDNALHIQKSVVVPFTFDATECPDLFPALVALAAGANGISTLFGVKRLRYKESNRGVVLQKEFAKLGLKIELDGDRMTIYGKGKLTNGTIHSNNDHRIAMVGAIAAGLTPKGVQISNAQSVNKSYPEFWDIFN